MDMSNDEGRYIQDMFENKVDLQKAFEIHPVFPLDIIECAMYGHNLKECYPDVPEIFVIEDTVIDKDIDLTNVPVFNQDCSDDERRSKALGRITKLRQEIRD